MSTSQHIAESLQNAVVKRDMASLVVCGGSSPLALFANLALAEIDWSRITVTLVDDRAVPATHADSNVLLLEQHLLVNKATLANFIDLNTEPEHVAGLDRPFDIVILGIGPDGHFASLFPDMMEDEEAFSPAAIPRILRTGPKGSPLHPRITMNLAMILQCRKLILLIQGTEKAAVLAASKTDTDLPVHRLISQTVTPVNIIRDGDIAT